MSIITRQARQEETRAVTDLLKSEHGDCSNFDINRFLVAIDNNRLVGCIRTKDISNNCVELSSLVIDKEYRNSGIGTKLVKEILLIETKRPIYLLCMDNREHFYNISGFTKIKVTKLPELMYNEYLRVAEKMPQIKDNIIAMYLE